MTERTRLTSVETVHEEGSWLFTVEDRYDDPQEVVLVPCEDEEASVQAWVNNCTHEAQRLDRGFGVAMRDGEIICPKHGSLFDACSGYCDNGEAAETTLVSVEIAVEEGDVYLTDDDRTFAHEGESGEEPESGAEEETDDERDDPFGDDDDDMPSSTSHLSF